MENILKTKMFFMDLIKKIESIYGEENVITIGTSNYFIFCQPVCDFKLLCAKGWIFRIWPLYRDITDPDKPTGFTILMEHYEVLNKFKPSQVTNQAYSIDEFIAKVKLITDNPIQAFVAAHEELPLSFPAYEKFVDEDGYPTNFHIGYQCKEDENGKEYQDTSIDKEKFIKKIFTEHWRYKRFQQRAANMLQQAYIPNLIHKVMDEYEDIKAVGIRDRGKGINPRYIIKLDFKIGKKLAKDPSYIRYYQDIVCDFMYMIDKSKEPLLLTELRLQDYDYKLDCSEVTYFPNTINTCQQRFVRESPKKILHGSRHRMMHRTYNRYIKQHLIVFRDPRCMEPMCGEW